MRVLSLFDGISVGCLALKRAGIQVDAYYASEIDKYAEKISGSNWDGIKRLGDVQNWPLWDGFMGVEDIDLIMAGSPCQGFSFAGKQLAFDDPRSKLYFEFVSCIKVFKPKYVLLENVRMKKEFQDIITETMQEALDSYGGGTIHKTRINSSLLSAQNRDRFYWTNWPVPDPEDRGILLRDILLTNGNLDLSFLEMDESKIVPVDNDKPGGVVGLYNGENCQATRVRDTNGKAQTLAAVGGGLGAKMGMYDLSTLEVDASQYKATDKDEIDPNKANVVGNVYPGGGQNGNVYSVDGKSKTLSAGTGIKGRGIGSSNAPKILLEDNYNERPNVVSQEVWRPNESEQEAIEKEIKDNTSDRCAGVQFMEDGVRPFNHNRKGTMSEFGKMKYPDQKSVAITAAHAPKVVEPPDGLVCRATVQANAEHTYDGKCPTLTASAGLGGGNVPMYGDKEIMDEHKGKYLGKERHNPRIRKLHPIECERLQTLPDNYTLVLDENGKQVVSDTQRYKALGNGWTCEAIVHILRYIVKKQPVVSLPKQPVVTQ